MKQIDFMRPRCQDFGTDTHPDPHPHPHPHPDPDPSVRVTDPRIKVSRIRMSRIRIRIRIKMSRIRNTAKNWEQLFSTAPIFFRRRNNTITDFQLTKLKTLPEHL